MKMSMKSKTVLKRPEKSQTDYEGQKKAKLCLWCYSSVSQPFHDLDYFLTSINLRGLKID